MTQARVQRHRWAESDDLIHGLAQVGYDILVNLALVNTALKLQILQQESSLNSILMYSEMQLLLLSGSFLRVSVSGMS